MVEAIESSENLRIKPNNVDYPIVRNDQDAAESIGQLSNESSFCDQVYPTETQRTLNQDEESFYSSDLETGVDENEGVADIDEYDDLLWSKDVDIRSSQWCRYNLEYRSSSNSGDDIASRSSYTPTVELLDETRLEDESLPYQLLQLQSRMMRVTRQVDASHSIEEDFEQQSRQPTRKYEKSEMQHVGDVRRKMQANENSDAQSTRRAEAGSTDDATQFRQNVLTTRQTSPGAGSYGVRIDNERSSDDDQSRQPSSDDDQSRRNTQKKSLQRSDSVESSGSSKGSQALSERVTTSELRDKFSLQPSTYDPRDDKQTLSDNDMVTKKTNPLRDHELNGDEQQQQQSWDTLDSDIRVRRGMMRQLRTSEEQPKPYEADPHRTTVNGTPQNYLWRQTGNLNSLTPTTKCVEGEQGTTCPRVQSTQSVQTSRITNVQTLDAEGHRRSVNRPNFHSLVHGNVPHQSFRTLCPENTKIPVHVEERRSASRELSRPVQTVQRVELTSAPSERELVWRTIVREELTRMAREEQLKRLRNEQLTDTDNVISKTQNSTTGIRNFEGDYRRRSESHCPPKQPWCASDGEQYDRQRIKSKVTEHESRRDALHDECPETKYMSRSRQEIQQKRRESSSSSIDSPHDRNGIHKGRGTAGRTNKKTLVRINSMGNTDCKENLRKKRYSKSNRDDAGDPSSGGSSGGGDSEGDRSYRDGSNAKGKRDKKIPPRKRNDDTDPSSDDEPNGIKQKKNVARPNHCMKPEKFNGKSSWETFLCQFENCARYNEWKPDDKVAYLRWSMTDLAAQMLWGTETYSYSQLVEKLGDRFGGHGIEEKFQHELRCRRRGKQESIRELAQDVQKLMSLAYPGEKSSMAEHIARDTFLSALDDPDLELKIREREPKDLESTVKLAQRFEVFKTQVETTSGIRHKVTRSTSQQQDIESRIAEVERRLDDKRPATYQNQPAERRDEGPLTDNGALSGRNSRRSRAVNQNNQQWKEDTSRQINELREGQESVINRTKDLAKENETLRKENERLKHLEQVRTSTAWNSQSTQQQPTEQPTSNQPRRMAGVCYNCDQPGHFARNCPLPRRTNYQPPAGLPARQSAQESRLSQSRPLQTGGVTTLNRRAGGHSTYLKASVGRCMVDCLLDTGSETTVIPASVVDAELIRSTSHVLTAANGTSIPLLGEVTLKIQIGRFTSSIFGLVTEHVDEVMIGIDWMTINRVVWQTRRISNSYRYSMFQPEI